MSDDPFITVEDLGDFLGRDLSADDGAVIAVDSACDVVRDGLEANVNAGTATVAFDGNGGDALVLPPLATDVSAVTVGGEAVDDWMFAADAGLLLRGTAGAAPRPTWPVGRQNVVATVVSGWEIAEVPRSIRLVALSVASRLVMQGGARREALGDASVEYFTPATDLTENERRILRGRRTTRSF